MDNQVRGERQYSDDPTTSYIERLGALIGELPAHLRLLAEIAPGSIEGYERLWREVMRDPDEGGALPRRYKAFIAIGLNTAARNRDAAVFWTRQGIRWGLQLEEAREAICFNITSTGMGTFLDLGQHCLAAARDEAEQIGTAPEVEPLPPFATPDAWKAAALPAGEQPLAERPGPPPEPGSREAAIHVYFERSFNAPMPEFWARLGRESGGILEGYYYWRRDNLRQPDEGGVAPKKIKELNVVGSDIILGNLWGAKAHLRAAMLNGATLAEVRELAALIIMEIGMVPYKLIGFDVVVHAEAITAILDQAHPGETAD